MNRMSLALAAAVTAASVAAAEAETVDFPLVDGQVTFTMPSNNVECIYTQAGGSSVYKPVGGGPELSCDRAQPKYVRVELYKSGKAARIDNPGDQPCCSVTNVLQYGQNWSKAPFSCLSAASGLTCTRDQHGFSISKETIKVY